jgi:hypothetical protein
MTWVTLALGLTKLDAATNPPQFSDLYEVPTGELAPIIGVETAAEGMTGKTSNASAKAPRAALESRTHSAKALLMSSAVA